MRVEFDRSICIGMFQCTVEWDAFERDEGAGKAVLAGGEENEEGIVAREVPEENESDATFAARTCPVDAIRINENNEQILP